MEQRPGRKPKATCKEACVLTLGKSHVDPKSVRYLFGGDLLRQGIATSMGVEDLQIPIFGLYGACSTSGEALALAAMSVAAGYGNRNSFSALPKWLDVTANM